MKRSLLAAVTLLLCLLGALPGCREPAATVDGMVTLDGQALGQGTITFHPAAAGRPAYGALAPDGRYSLRTGGTASVAPGLYRVTVVALEASTPPADAFSMPAPGNAITPPRYASPTTSDVSADVQPGENKLNFALVRP